MSSSAGSLARVAAAQRVIGNRPVVSVLATTLKGGLGKDGSLPWKIPQDTKWFEFVTSKLGKECLETKNDLVMGRKTFLSLPPKFRPLPFRDTTVLSHSLRSTRCKGLEEAVNHDTSTKNDIVATGPYDVASTLQEALERLKEAKQDGTIFIVGGKSLYDETHSKRLADLVFWTRVVGTDIETDVSVDLKALMRNYDVVAVSKSYATAGCSYDFLVLARREESAPETDFANGETVREYSERAESKACLPESSVPQSPVRNAPAKSNAEGVCPAGSGEARGSFKIEALEKAGTDAAKVGLPRSTSFARQLVRVPLTGFERTQLFEHEEFQYLAIMEEIMASGVDSDDRTGVGTLSKFGCSMRFDLSETFPLLTTKRVYWKGVLEELLWFIAGKTDAKLLADKDVHIWDDNGSREFLDKQGLRNRREGDLGPVYGFQWRHFGAEYRDADSDYTGQGVDQLKGLVYDLKHNPTSRRHILSAWNPAALREMALPPCHILSQFNVGPSKELSCILYQRSADWGLGVPFNIASYALLTCILAHLTGLKPKEFVHVCGNAHIYKNHIEPLKHQLGRLPRPFPTLRISPRLKDLDDIQADDFELRNYSCWPTIKMPMAV